MNGADHYFLVEADLPGNVLNFFDVRARFRFRADLTVKLLEIVPGTKSPSGALKHNHIDMRVIISLLQRGRQGFK